MLIKLTVLNFVLLVVIIFKAYGSICRDESTENFNYFQDKDKTNLTFSMFGNFNKLSDLILGCNKTYNITKNVVMWPKTPLVIDENFQVNKIFSQKQIDSLVYFNMGNLKGIDINSKPFINGSKQLRQKTIFNIYYSKFDVYSNSILIEASKCDSVTYNTSTNFIQYFISLSIHNGIYPKILCPFFFKNFELRYLIFYRIINSFLITNRLNFFKLNSSNVSIKNLIALQFDLTYENLNENNLSPELFKNTRNIAIGGVLTGIQECIFEKFINLNNIEIVISNLKEFFQGGNRWMNYLNLNVSFASQIRNLSFNKSMKLNFRQLNQNFSFNSIYDYPNQDLCLFKDFPHRRLVFPVIIPGKRLNCTCTLFWLQSNLHLFTQKINLIHDYDLSLQGKNYVFVFCDESFNSTECNFGQKFTMCKKIEKYDKREHQTSLENDDDVLYIIKFIEYILLVIFQPILSFMGIIHNGLIILVIKNTSMKKVFQESMYGHIIMNAVFNIIYCVIMILKLVNTCVFYGPSVFCSIFYHEFWAQKFKMVAIHFLGNVTKMCSNFSYFMFSASRLLLITKKNGRDVSQKNKKFYFFIYVFLLILFCCFLSAFKLFQYKINNQLEYNKEFPLEQRDEFFCQNENHKYECQLFKIFKILNRSFNDVLFVISNVLIDLILLIRFKRHMKSKLHQINDLSQRTLIEKSKKSLNRMILFNSFIYILSHLPEFSVTLLLIIYAKKILNFCNNKFSCDLVNEEAEVFGLISIVCQFYVFKMFDANFKRSFNDIKSCLFSFICRCKKEKKRQMEQRSLELKNLNNLIGNGIID